MGIETNPTRRILRRDHLNVGVETSDGGHKVAIKGSGIRNGREGEEGAADGAVGVGDDDRDESGLDSGEDSTDDCTCTVLDRLDATFSLIGEVEVQTSLLFFWHMFGSSLSMVAESSYMNVGVLIVSIWIGVVTAECS